MTAANAQVSRLCGLYPENISWIHFLGWRYTGPNLVSGLFEEVLEKVASFVYKYPYKSSSFPVKASSVLQG